MALHVIALETGVEVAADIEIQGSPDPRCGLFNYTGSVQALPEAIRSALLGGAIAGQHEARARGIIDGIDEVNIASITLRGEGRNKEPGCADSASRRSIADSHARR